MINLLSDERKDEIRAARVNVILVRYIVIIAVAIVFLLGSLALSYAILEVTRQSAQAQISANDVKSDVYKETREQVESLGQSLQTAKTILDNEVPYSKVLTGIGQLMPEGTIIDTVTLTSASFSGSPTTLKVYAKTSEAAVALQSRFQSSPLFSGVSFQTIEESDETIDGYPVSVTMSLTLNKAGIQ
ncbi:PilN domain-containing protein [Candidatus Saccharibacteria bacterium]|nr:PilN domain-containing protein [Candidatus Saccharibacteria bacterium]